MLKKMLNRISARTQPFHAVDDGEGSREVTVQHNLAAQVFVQLDNHAEELWRGSQVAP